MPYTDQFDRTDPLTFNPLGFFNLWPRQAVFEARALLRPGRSTEDLKEIAAGVEAMIRNEVDRVVRLSRETHAGNFGPNPKTWIWPDEDHDRLRERVGDTNLYQSALWPAQARLPAPCHFEDWEGYAVIALWQLVDFMDALRAPRRRLIAAHWPKNGLDVHEEGEKASRLFAEGARVPKPELLEAQRLAAPALVEAVRACTLAAECRLRAMQIGALTTRAQRDRALAIERADMLRRQTVSEKARESAAVKHQDLPAHREEAWKLANSKWFPTRMAAARYAAERIAKSETACYTEDTVDDWLKARGWQRQPVPEGETAPRKRRKR